MDTHILQELLLEVEARGGGLVLNNGDNPQAVVLSVGKYYQLLQGVPVMGTDLNNATTGEQNSSNGTVLVTGGAGYIGAHVVRTLLEAGRKVVVVDNLSTGLREHLSEGVPFHEGNVGDINFLRGVFKEHAIDAVIHLAASLEVQESVEQPVPYLHNNTVVTLQLLTAMSEANVKTIVFSSTAAVYGEQAIIPISETAAPQPNNPYGHSKLLAEGVLRYFSEWRGFTVTALRYFNVCGTHPEWGIVDTHKNSHLIPVILEVALGVRDKMVVNGGDYDTSDGSCVRDYIHVWDIARAHVAALGRSATEKYKTYNVATGHGVSVKDMISTASEITGRMIPMEIGPRRPGDAAITIADNKLITKELGFKPEHSDLETIFKTSWDSVKK